LLEFAAVLAITTAYAPVLLDRTAGVNLTPTVLAYGHPGGGC
jgi:hypothetical protein